MMFSSKKHDDPELGRWEIWIRLIVVMQCATVLLLFSAHMYVIPYVVMPATPATVVPTEAFSYPAPTIVLDDPVPPFVPPPVHSSPAPVTAGCTKACDPWSYFDPDGLILIDCGPKDACPSQCPRGSGGPYCNVNSMSLFFQENIYKRLRVRPTKVFGWNVEKELYERLIAETNASFIVELGVWQGASLLIFGDILKQRGQGGLALGVDTYLGALEFWDRHLTEGKLDPSTDLELVNGFPSVYYTMLSNIANRRLTEYVLPFPVPSKLGAARLKQLGGLIDFLHIDASHEYVDVVEDIQLWWPLIAPGGIMMGDDYLSWPGVRQAVDEFIEITNLKLHTASVKWWVYRPPLST